MARTGDPQAMMRKAGAKRRRFAVQVSIGDMSHVHSPVVIAPTQHLSPISAVRIAARPKHFERRSNPQRFGSLRFALLAVDFDGEACCAHRVGAK